MCLLKKRRLKIEQMKFYNDIQTTIKLCALSSFFCLFFCKIFANTNKIEKCSNGHLFGYEHAKLGVSTPEMVTAYYGPNFIKQVIKVKFSFGFGGPNTTHVYYYDSLGLRFEFSNAGRKFRKRRLTRIVLLSSSNCVLWNDLGINDTLDCVATRNLQCIGPDYVLKSQYSSSFHYQTPNGWLILKVDSNGEANIIQRIALSYSKDQSMAEFKEWEELSRGSPPKIKF